MVHIDFLNKCAELGIDPVYPTQQAKAILKELGTKNPNSAYIENKSKNINSFFVVLKERKK